MEPGHLGALALALIFLLTSFAKIQGPQPFLAMTEKLGLGGYASKTALAAIVFIEINLGLLWAMAWQAEILSLVTASLFVLFALFLEILWRKGHRESCGCYGGVAKVTPRQGIRLNLIYAAMAVFVWSEIGPWSSSHLPWWTFPTGFSLAVVAVFRAQK